MQLAHKVSPGQGHSQHDTNLEEKQNQIVVTHRAELRIRAKQGALDLSALGPIHWLASILQKLGIVFAGAFWTYTVAKLGLRMSGDVPLHFLPDVFLIPNLFAETANGQ